MGKLSEEPSETLMKLLLIGDSKAGKTHYAMQAAEIGFNVLYMDGDVARPTLNKLSPNAKARTYYMNVADYIDDDGRYISKFKDTVTDFCIAGKDGFHWNSITSSVAKATDDNSDGHIDTLIPGLLGENTVWIIDSWTAYTQSLMEWKAEVLGRDLADVEQFGQDLYAGTRNKADQTLQIIRAAKCHVIVIAHSDEYTKTQAPIGAKLGAVRQKDMTIKGFKDIPRSVSRPHSLTMGKYFTDIGWLEYKGMNRRIDFTTTDTRIAGGHLEGRNLDDNSGSLLMVIESCGAKIPSGSQEIPWLKPFVQKVPQAPQIRPPLQSKDGPAARIGLAGMMKK